VDKNRKVVQSQPALFNNRCYTFLAQDIKKGCRSPYPHQTEDIETGPYPLWKKIPGLISKGEIDHAMVITAFTINFLQHPED